MALWLLLLVQGVLLLLIYRHFGLATLGTIAGIQRDGLPVGERAPAISGVTAEGAVMPWAPERHGRSQLLLFLAPNCQSCAQILPLVNQLACRANGHGPSIVGITPGGQESAVQLAEKLRPSFLCLATDEAVPNYRVRVTPFGFVVGKDGRILAKGLCSDAVRLRDLLITGGMTDAAAALAPNAEVALQATRATAQMARR